MKHVFIIDPTAGKRSSYHKYLEMIKSSFNNREEEYIIELVGNENQARDIPVRYGKTGEKVRIYAFGGDGTVNQVVNGAYGYDNLEFAAYPAGSGNDFVKIMGDVDWSNLNNLIDGEVKDIDLIKVNDRYCANVANVGFDAMVAANAEKYKQTIGGHLAYLLSVFTTLAQDINMKVKIWVDEALVFFDTALLCYAANGKVYGGGFNVAPNASVTDGILDFAIAKSQNFLGVCGFVGKFKKGNHEALADILYKFCGKTMRIESENDLCLCIDGDISFVKKCNISVVPKAIKCVFPITKNS